jgi:putative DNA primase/helicase
MMKSAFPYEKPGDTSSNFKPSIYNIPDELKALPQWVLWRKESDAKGRPTKVPYQPNGRKASSTNPKTWFPFQKVLKRYQSGSFDGIGFVFSENDDFIGVDLDHILDDAGNVKESEPWAADVIRKLSGSYMELSPSGDGLHIIIKGQIPRSGNDGKPGNKPHLEMYSSGRYFTITGHLWSNDNADN